MDDIQERLFELSGPWWELVLRAAVVYTVVLLMIRIVGKRTVGQYTPFDLVVVVLLGTAVQNSLIGDDISLVGGLLIAATLLGMNWMVGFLSARCRGFDAFVEGRPVLLARNGRVFHRELSRQSVSEEDFAMAMRKADCRGESDIHLAILETSGDITVLKERSDMRLPSPDPLCASGEGTTAPPTISACKGGSDMSGKPEQQTLPPQEQARQPGRQAEMHPQPESIRESYRGSGRLAGKVALVTGGDSGIGRAVALHFAREGATVAFGYLDEKQDAQETERLIAAEKARCLSLAGDLGDPAFCGRFVRHVVDAYGRLDILVNNAAEQHTVESPEDLSPERIERTFRTNLFSCMHMAAAAIPFLEEGGSIINTGSITGVRGHATLIDYASTKGAIHALTFSLAQSLAGRGIRVNAVAPGPVWTPLIPASFTAEEVATFGSDTLLKRPAQPSEIAPAYVFLASEEASYITGQIIHINGGGRIGG